MLMNPDRQKACASPQGKILCPADAILRALVGRAGHFVPGSELVRGSGLSRSGVWKHIVSLRRQGFQIAASIRKGYCLETTPDILLPVIVQAGLDTAIFGREIMFYQTIDSTNRIAREQAEAGAREGTVVIAEEQTTGKGRLGRAWISPAGSNILCSVILYPGMVPSDAFKLTMLASVAVVRAIQNVCGQVAQIKWPNDVYISGRKVCGVLTEFMADHSSLTYVVIGIGLNVNLDPSRHPEIMETATSLQEACGRPISRPALLRALLQEIEGLYGELHKNGGRTLKEAWEQHSMVLNQEVDIISGHEILTGVVKGISNEGHLILLDNNGAIHNIICGDLSLRVKQRAMELP